MHKRCSDSNRSGCCHRFDELSSLHVIQIGMNAELLVILRDTNDSESNN